MSDALKALAELVALEDRKKSLAQASHHAVRFPTDENYAMIDELSTDIGKRKPLAWAAARSALAAGQEAEPYTLTSEVIVPSLQREAVAPLTLEFIEQHIGPYEGDREAVLAVVREVEKAHGIQ